MSVVRWILGLRTGKADCGGLRSRRTGRGRGSGSTTSCFPKGLYYKKIPAFVIGRPGWDNWLLW
jgi:hypothetical protein